MTNAQRSRYWRSWQELTATYRQDLEAGLISLMLEDAKMADVWVANPSAYIDERSDEYEAVIVNSWLNTGLASTARQRAESGLKEGRFNYKDSEWLDQVLAYLRLESATRVTYVTDTTVNLIRDTMIDTTAQGLGARQQGRELARRITEFSKARALTIARTEVMTASSVARDRMFREFGLEAETRKEWVSTRDHRTREAHRALDGVTLPYGQPFYSPVTGSLLEYPHDSSLGATGADVINCRCVLRYIV